LLRSTSGTAYKEFTNEDFSHHDRYQATCVVLETRNPRSWRDPAQSDSRSRSTCTTTSWNQYQGAGQKSREAPARRSLYIHATVGMHFGAASVAAFVPHSVAHTAP